MDSPPKWHCPATDGGNPAGGGDVVSNLFGGKRSCNIDTFCREDNQNHVDALDEDNHKLVDVRIHDESISREVFEIYFPQEFQRHFRSSELSRLTGDDRSRRENEIDELFESNKVPILVIEDFNTIGLNGPVNSKNPQKIEGEPFYHPHNALTCFLRRNGVSGKSDKKLGSAGLGRHVYYMASKIRSKLIYTVPTDMSRKTPAGLESITPRPIFFGQACLNELMIDPEHEIMYGNYHTLTPGKDDINVHQTESNAVYRPYGLKDNEEQFVDRVRKDFNLIRKADQTGLSIIIPFPRPNLNETNFVNAIAKSFPIPILDERLTVRVNEKQLDQNTIITASEDEQVSVRNQFLADAKRHETKTLIDVAVAELEHPLGRDSFPDEDTLPELAGRFAEGELVGIRVMVRFGEKPSQQGEFRVYAKRTPTDCKGNATVARDGYEITEHSDSRFSNQWSAYVDVGTDALGELLKASEDPSHTRWIAADITDRCPVAAQLIQFVAKSHHHFVTLLRNHGQEADTQTWADLFPAAGNDGNPPPPPPPPPAQPRPFILKMTDSQTALITPTDDLKATDIESPWNIEVLFDTVRGNRQHAYRPGSISFENVSVEVKGGKLTKAEQNRLIVQITNHVTFTCTVGPCEFPDWADVHLQAKRVEAAETSEGAD